MMKLTTPRLTLFPFDLIYVQMHLDGHEFFKRTFPFRVPDSWPWKEMDEIAPWLKDQLLRNPELACWLTWLVVQPQDKQLIGDIGFGGPPDRDGVLEMGYSIVPEYRNRGYGSEAAAALVAWAFAQPGSWPSRPTPGPTARPPSACWSAWEWNGFRKLPPWCTGAWSGPLIFAAGDNRIRRTRTKAIS